MVKYDLLSSFPAALSFTTCPLHPGRRWSSISQAKWSMKEAALLDPFAGVAVQQFAFQHYKKIAASEQGEKHIMGQISSAAGQESSNTS